MPLNPFLPKTGFWNGKKFLSPVGAAFGTPPLANAHPFRGDPADAD
ncbi:MAG: hypothetical protein R3B54_08150 [Bdellovibrionota bacterium]